MIIDDHVHVAAPPYNDEPLSFSVYDGRTLPFPLARSKASPQCLLEDMDACGVDVAFVNAIPGWATNEEVAEAVKEHPDRLRGFAWVTDPRDGESSVEELSYAVESLGLHGLKMHPGLQGFSPADPMIVPLVEKAADLDLPVFFHTGAWPSGSYSYCLPQHLDVLAHRVPDAAIVVGHMGYLRFMDTVAMVPMYAGEKGGLYVDTSMGLAPLVYLYGVEFVAKCIRMIGVDRVLFGSDWGGGIARMREDNLNIINEMDLTPEEKEKILGGNASRLLGL